MTNKWNTLPKEVVTANNVNEFKNKLDEYLKYDATRFVYDANLQTSDL